MIPRRKFIISAAAAGVVTPWRIFAQSGRALVLAQKHALVIGNSAYKRAPLKNPARDAKAMAAVLRHVGFDVTLALEATQSALQDTIRAYLDLLTKTKSVGLFYFAGHGIQLAWRNYLIPVDAEIASVDDLRLRALDVNSLIDGIRKAANPMNIIILDACRNNPFGSVASAVERGLSQLDAPPATLLAYATAPGNTADDGDGEHGLYTEHLLREMKVPEARVEDVFKRVRLAVRRRSSGQQIPWESTSLEEDFWFIPPREVKELAEAEIEREFRVELAIWERTKNATDTALLENYLRRYPSGRFTELAQLKLDQLLEMQGEKRIRIAVASKNPYSSGSGRANTAYRIGDSYIYRVTNMSTGAEEKPFRYVITDITENEIIFNNGSETADLLGNLLKTAAGPIRGPNQIVPLEFAVGRRWSTRFDTRTPQRASALVDLQLAITTRESVTVPAGMFDCFRLEGKGWAQSARGSEEWRLVRWYAPDRLRNYVKAEIVISRGSTPLTARRSELSSYTET